MIHISFVRIRFTAHSFRALRGHPTPGREVFISHMKATNSCSSPQHHSPSSCLQPQQADARRIEGCCSWRLATQGGVCVSRFVLSGGRDHPESVWPCARAPRVTSPRPARAGEERPPPPPAGARPALPLCSVASVCGGPVRPLGAGVTHGPSFVVSALRATAAARAVLLGRGPEDCPRALLGGSPRRKGEAGAGLHGRGALDCGGTAPGSPPWLRPGLCPPHPTPPLSRIIQVSKPAILQTEHFVNLHREQIQQSRVEPFLFFFFFERSVTLTCPPLSSHPCGPPPSGIAQRGGKHGVSVPVWAGLGGGRGSPVPRTRNSRSALRARPRGVLSRGSKGGG